MSTSVKPSPHGFIENRGQLVMYGVALLALAVFVYACVCEG
jgi:hypothetical protein